MSDPIERGPGVRYPPPIPFVLAFAAGVLLHRRVFALPLPPGGRMPASVAIGWLLVAAAIVLNTWAMTTFVRARTTMIPHRAARALVRAGPYRFTRNPMYVGLTVAYTGGALIVGSWWPLLLLPFPLLLVVRSIVPREERHLAAVFGDDYESYRREVPRFLGAPRHGA